jgi:hypothetical protein
MAVALQTQLLLVSKRAIDMSSCCLRVVSFNFFACFSVLKSKLVVDYWHLKILHKDFCYNLSNSQAYWLDTCYRDFELS